MHSLHSHRVDCHPKIDLCTLKYLKKIYIRDKINFIMSKKIKMDQEKIQKIRQINKSKLLTFTENMINKYIKREKIITNHTTIPLRTFIEKVLTRSNSTFNILILINIYFERYINTKNIEITDERKIFVGVLILTFKYWCDYYYKNKEWAKLFGLEIEEINRIERLIFNKIKLYVSLEFFNEDKKKYK